MTPLEQATLRLCRNLRFEFDSMSRLAERNQTCQRKSVGCSIVLPFGEGFQRVAMSFNGPTSRVPQTHLCSGEKGNCGCGHAEPKAMLAATELISGRKGAPKHGYVMLCDYTPCTGCANVILASPLVRLLIYKIMTEHDRRGYEMLENCRDMTVFDIHDLDEAQNPGHPLVRCLIQMQPNLVSSERVSSERVSTEQAS